MSAIAAAEASFRPEAELVAVRNVSALYFKYMAVLGRDERDMVAELPASEDIVPDTSLTLGYAKQKDVGGLIVENVTGSATLAADTRPPVGVWLHDTPVQKHTALHISEAGSHPPNRASLGAAACYIGNSNELLRNELVTATTYPELGYIGLLLGMRQMRIQRMTEYEQDRVLAYRWIYQALNGKERADEAEPVALYLPTQEFVTRFLPYYDNRFVAPA